MSSRHTQWVPSSGGQPDVRSRIFAEENLFAERVIEQLAQALGIDRERAHFGTSVHAATGAGEVELLQLIIDRGGDGSVRNAQGQTPLQLVAAGRATRDRLAQAQALMNSMGIKLPGLVDQLSNVTLPLEGWDACERLLRERGAH